MKNYLVIGAGLYGSVFARCLAEKNKKVLVLDKRKHIGGNCYSEKIDNINVHKYGPHAFHTNSQRVWEFVNRFAQFNDFKLQVKVNYKGTVYSFPVNLMTLNQIYGVTNPKEAKQLLSKIKKKNGKQDNFKNYVLSNLGEELFSTFYDGYTRKQWNCDTSELPSFIAKRIPIRLEYNDFYFNDKYQGIPLDGYTSVFERMLDHKNIKVETDVDFFADKESLERKFSRIVYSGKVDELYDYRHGILGYRSLRFEFKRLRGTFQGAPIMNYSEYKIPFTRTVEYKFFDKKESDRTVISIEYPDDYGPNKTPFYPLPTESNRLIYEKYKDIADKDSRYIVGGRLGRYIYLNMDQVIGMALTDADRELGC
jgi:UDP-galactopyranose mutase